VIALISTSYTEILFNTSTNTSLVILVHKYISSIQYISYKHSNKFWLIHAVNLTIVKTNSTCESVHMSLGTVGCHDLIVFMKVIFLILCYSLHDPQVLQFIGQQKYCRISFYVL
jgi:hypothetical protein